MSAVILRVFVSAAVDIARKVRSARSEIIASCRNQFVRWVFVTSLGCKAMDISNVSHRILPWMYSPSLTRIDIEDNLASVSEDESHST